MKYDETATKIGLLKDLLYVHKASDIVLDKIDEKIIEYVISSEKVIQRAYDIKRNFLYAAYLKELIEDLKKQIIILKHDFVNVNKHENKINKIKLQFDEVKNKKNIDEKFEIIKFLFDQLYEIRTSIISEEENLRREGYWTFVCRRFAPIYGIIIAIYFGILVNYNELLKIDLGNTIVYLTLLAGIIWWLIIKINDKWIGYANNLKEDEGEEG